MTDDEWFKILTLVLQAELSHNKCDLHDRGDILTVAKDGQARLSLWIEKGRLVTTQGGNSESAVYFKNLTELQSLVSDALFACHLCFRFEAC